MSNGAHSLLRSNDTTFFPPPAKPTVQYIVLLMVTKPLRDLHVGGMT
jgi:hypothetical protein